MVTGCTGGDTEPNYNIVGDNRIKKVFKIPVGNIPDDEIEDYIRKVSEKFKKATQIQPDLDCGIYKNEDTDKDICYFLPTNNENKMHSNYSHVIPNSHFWTDLTQIKYSIDYQIEREKRELEVKDNNTIYVGEPLTKDYILIGLGNSLMRGYKLKQKNKKSYTYIVFESIEDMIEYVQNERWFNLEDFRDIINNTINVGFNLTNGLKMERKEVYKRLDGERDYQDSRKKLRTVPDEEKPIAEWLIYMEHHLKKAKKATYYLNNEETLSRIRIITALGVRAMEIHGCPERKIVEIVDPPKDECSDNNCDCKK